MGRIEAKLYQLFYLCLWYNIIYLLTAIVVTPGGSSTVLIYTPKNICNNTVNKNNTINNRTTKQLTTRTQQRNWEERGPCPVFANYTLAFAIQLRKNHGKPSVRIAEECQLARWKQNMYSYVLNHKFGPVRWEGHLDMTIEITGLVLLCKKVTFPSRS